MATYIELRNLFDEGALRNKVIAATVIAANNLLLATPTTADRAFADAVFASPAAIGKKVYMSVLAANKDADVASVQSASDSAIQAQVDTVVPALVSALAGV